jgi:glycerophosphoryl diester phosphodiesterase
MTAWLRDRPIAHRGLHDLAGGVPENSLAAFEAACRAGYGIELDVQLTADGEVAAFHDWELDRLTGESGKLAARSMKELGRLPLAQSDQTIPNLGEVLSLVAGRTPLIVEIKNPLRRAVPIEAAVNDLLLDYRGDVAVSSFNPFSLAWFARRSAKYPRGQNYDFDPRRSVHILWRLGSALRDAPLKTISRPDFLVFDHRALPHRIAVRLRRLGLPILAYTVRSEPEWRAVKPHVDNIIFESFLP